MPVRSIIPFREGVYFITFTCYQWIPLIRITNAYDLIYNWFDFLKKSQHFICGYVIMPNHVHLLIGFRETDQSINTIVGNGKRFMAYEVVKRLKALNLTILLERLEQAVNKKDHQSNKRHEIWQPSFDWKICDSERFINQKLDYMHDNPCQGIWNLAGSPLEYKHSSARFYLLGEHAAYPITHYQELDDIDLTR